jgi:hypothetical protein
MAYGTCKLTKSTGKLVRSHLLPKALTKTPEPGLARAEGFDLGRPVRRFDGWYDSGIVTRKGEDILSRYDDFAIKELRRLKLVWSGWQDPGELDGIDLLQPDGSAGLGRLAAPGAKRLRLFFLSLLWRAAVTDLVGYRVPMDGDRLEELTRMVAEGDPEPLSFFPVTLTQLTTKGPWHNAGPRLLTKKYPSEEPNADVDVDFYRFYLEGLIAHIDDDRTDAIASRFGSYALGSGEEIIALTRPYEGSHQAEWLEVLMLNSLENHADVVNRIFRMDREVSTRRP